jgi:hypothetical protein
MIVYYSWGTPLGTANDADIWLDDSETWAPYGETDLSFFAVALHEIGHVIGLDHVEDTSEIMNSFVSANGLGDGDLLGAQILYGDAEGNVVEPPEPEVVAASGGGSGMGFLLLILGALAALLGLGPGGIMAAAAMSREDDQTDEPPEQTEGPLLTDLIPSTGSFSEVFHQLHEFDLEDDHSDAHYSGEPALI